MIFHKNEMTQRIPLILQTFQPIKVLKKKKISKEELTVFHKGGLSLFLHEHD